VTVAEMIEALKAMPQDLQVWSLGIEIHGYASAGLAQMPELYTPHGENVTRVVIDGGCV
jgi:hypothetical protein